MSCFSMFSRWLMFSTFNVQVFGGTPAMVSLLQLPCQPNHLFTSCVGM